MSRPTKLENITIEYFPVRCLLASWALSRRDAYHELLA
jgi:hypothetical protein